MNDTVVRAIHTHGNEQYNTGTHLNSTLASLTQKWMKVGSQKLHTTSPDDRSDLSRTIRKLPEEAQKEIFLSIKCDCFHQLELKDHDDSHIRQWGKILPIFSRAKFLDFFPQSKFGTSAFKELTRGISKMHLKDFSLTPNFSTRMGTQNFVDLLHCLSKEPIANTLTELELEHFDLTDADFLPASLVDEGLERKEYKHRLAEFLDGGVWPRPLKELSLAFKKILDHQNVRILRVNMLLIPSYLVESPGFRKLLELTLQLCVTDKGAKTIAESLPRSALEKLDLEHNMIGEKGVKSLFDVLHFSNVRELDIHNNPGSHEAFSYDHKSVEVLYENSDDEEEPKKAKEDKGWFSSWWS